jgi:hypothetical protein
MKRFVILLIIAIVGVSASVYADTSTLIDFSKLVADSNGQNTATLVDFGQSAGASFTPAEKAQMKTSLALDNWQVKLNSSARSVTNQELSYTKAVTVNKNATKFGGDLVLGIRVHFPQSPYNAFAEIMPPFDIPAYMQKNAQDTQGTKFDGYGVVKNVGTIKSLAAEVYGSNFPNGFAVVLQNQNNEDKTVFLNNLDFDGWKTLQWENPNYINDVRNRQIVRTPLYPKATPYYKLVGMIIYKDAQQQGGDIITYVKDITMTYDKAVLSLQRDINDEAVWGILSAREAARRHAEAAKIGNLQVLRYLESQKMAGATENAASAAAAGGK